MAIVHASLWMNHLKSYLSPIVIRSTLSHDNLSYTLMSFKSFFMSFVYNKSLFWELKKQYIHQNIAKNPSVFVECLFIISSQKKKERKKKLRETYLKKHFHPHLNWKVSLFGNLRKLWTIFKDTNRLSSSTFIGK